MTVTHPLAERDATPAAVTGPDGDTHPVDEDGEIDCPEDAEGDLREALEDAYADDEADEGDGLTGFDPNDHTVDEVRAHVESINGDDIVAELEAIRDAEVEGKDRTTALDAIDARLNDVRED